MTPRLRCLAWIVAGLGCAVSSSAQCASDWRPGALPGVAGEVAALAPWDPDGPGPLTARIVVGGLFRVAGPLVANNLAMFDPATGQWSAFATGTDGPVSALAVLTDGSLVVGGNFGSAGGQPCAHIARWTGAAFAPLGSGFDDKVSSLLALPNGELVAGGAFTASGAQPANCIARWNGSAWSAIGSGFQVGLSSSPPEVAALARMPNGDLIAGGTFVNAGNVVVNHIARFDGVAWQPMAGGMTGLFGVRVGCLGVRTNGELIASGAFVLAGGQHMGGSGFAAWNGTSWTQVAGASGGAGGFIVLANGDLAVGVYGVDLVGAAGATSLMSTDGQVLALLELPGGDLAIGGAFATAAGLPAQNVALQRGGAWQAVGPSLFDGPIASLATLANGDLVAAGNFTRVGSLPTSGMARFDGQSWSAMPAVAAQLLPTRDGGLLGIGGTFGNGLGRWNGTAWAAIPTPVVLLDNSDALAELPNGDVLVLGIAPQAAFARRVLRWNGSSWTQLGGDLAGFGIAALTVLRDGSPLVAGGITSIGGVNLGAVARWNGTAWVSYGPQVTLGGSSAGVSRAVSLRDGGVVLSGPFASWNGTATNVVRGDGSTWAPLSAGVVGSVEKLAEMPDGQVVAVGGITMASDAAGAMFAANAIARWNGTRWLPFGAGLAGERNGITASALAIGPDGDVIVGGRFLAAGDGGAAFFARWGSNCAATATSYGTGCVGSAGPLVLAVERAPWLGGALEARATGIAPGALAFDLLGFAAEQSPLVLGGPGCTRYVTPLVTTFLPAVGGTVSTRLAVPVNPALVGIAVREQVVQIELDGTGAITALSSSNGIVATVGSY